MSLTDKKSCDFTMNGFMCLIKTLSNIKDGAFFEIVKNKVFS